jgi:hypothetical protein
MEVTWSFPQLPELGLVPLTPSRLHYVSISPGNCRQLQAIAGTIL